MTVAIFPKFLIYIDVVVILFSTTEFRGVAALQDVGGAEYGYPCKQRNDSSAGDLDLCSLKDHLICLVVNATTGESSCGCQSHMYRDPLLEKCIVKAGERCLDYLDGTQFPTICTKNSYCNQPGVNLEGICECRAPNFIPTKLGKCLMGFETYGCVDESNECSQDAFLSCNRSANICVCDQDKAAWNNGKLRCEGLSGATCGIKSPEQDCTENAVCSGDICQCSSPAYIPAINGRCRLAYAEPCITDSECASNFACIPDLLHPENATKCLCTSGRYYSPSSIQCLPRIYYGLDCDPTEGGCIDQASCSAVTKKCQCDAGYEEDGYNYCKGTLGTGCRVDTDCNTVAYLSCNSSGVCSCSPGQKYQNNKCLAYIGQDCSISAQCIGGGICNPYQCECPYRTTASKDKDQCYGDFGYSCYQPDDVCNPEKFFTCTENICTCLPDLLYQGNSNDDHNSCRSKAGARCNLTLKCVDNADCVYEEDVANKDEGVCTCTQGYQSTNAGDYCSYYSSGYTVGASLCLKKLFMMVAGPFALICYIFR